MMDSYLDGLILVSRDDQMSLPGLRFAYSQILHLFGLLDRVPRFEIDFGKFKMISHCIL